MGNNRKRGTDESVPRLGLMSGVFYSSSVMIHIPFRCDPSRRMLPVSFSFATSRLTVACETESFSPYALYVKLGF